jgi:hypothetical protein
MPLEPLTKPIDLEPNVQDLMNHFKSVIETARINAMCLYLRLNKETGEQQWAVNVLDLEIFTKQKQKLVCGKEVQMVELLYQTN